MRKKYFKFRRIATTLLSLFLCSIAWAQPSVQDCLGAIPVCKKIYEQDDTFRGEGDVQDFEAGLICMDTEQNSVWYTFQVNNTGQFGFLITPRDLRDDYDWALFNITTASCDDIRNDPARYLVSCNAAGGDNCNGLTGATGESVYSVQGANCNNPVASRTDGITALNELIDVERGNIYVLVVNNWVGFGGGARSGYTIDFGLSTDIGIFDEQPPGVELVELVDNCSGGEIAVRFSERIQCATISSDNFSLVGPGGDIPVELFSQECENGYYYSEFFILRPQSPIRADGDYTLTVDLNGSTEALDLCNNPAFANEFQIPNPAEDVIVDLGRNISQCSGVPVTLDASNVSGLDYRWSTGASGSSSIEVTEPGTYSVTVTTNCGETTDDVEVIFTDGPPDIELGEDRLLCPMDTFILDATTPGATYLWQDGANEPTHVVDRTGTYSVTVTTKCGTATDRITYNYGEANFLVDLGEDQTTCASDEGVSLDATIPEDAATYLWNDGYTEATRSVTQSGVYSVVVSTECGTATDEVEISFIGEDANLIDLGEDFTICEDEEAILDVSTDDAVYLWQDGSITPSITVSESGLYKVTVTTDCVVNTDSVLVTVQETGSINLVPDTVMCEGASLILDVTINDTLATYEWQDGTQSPIYEVMGAGNYTVTISNECGDVNGMITVNLFDSLQVQLPGDTIVCATETILLEPTGNATDYLWQDGSTNASFEVKEPGTYTLIAGNECEETSLDVVIDECITCQFYVPNAISPNGDGRNDVFMPYTSFECKIQDYNLQIFDRWGALIHETDSYETGWDGIAMGEVAQDGLYVYQISLNVLENGILKPVVLSGEVMMMR